MALILVVDDELFICAVISEFLEDAGFEAVSAPNGRQALEIAIERHPDLVITDLMMPNMNGLELTQSLREDDQFAGLPIILITGGHGLLAQQNGDQFELVLNKPFDLDVLVESVTMLLAKRPGPKQRGLMI